MTVIDVVFWAVVVVVVIAGIVTWFSWANAFVQAGYEFRADGRNYLSTVVICIFLATILLVVICGVIIYVMWSLLA